MSAKVKRSGAATFASAKLLLGSLLLLGLLSAGAGAQSLDGSTPLALAPGAPAGSYALSNFDSVNPYNGNLNFSLTLLRVGGRGALSVPVNLQIQQKWHLEPVDTEWGPYYVADPDWWASMNLSYNPGTVLVRSTGDGQQQCHINVCQDCYAFRRTLTRLTFVAPDGTEYELRDQATDGKPLDNSCPPLTQPWLGQSRGRTFVTTDGTTATFISDGPLMDSPSYPTAEGATGLLKMKDGTVYRVEGGSVMWVRDHNGNKLSFDYTVINDPVTGFPYGYVVSDITDSLNRQVTFEYNLTDAQHGLHNKITYKGFGGAARAVRISYAPLQELLRPGYTLKTYAALFGPPNSTATQFNPHKPAAVWLPDGRSYRFAYNSHGELARVKLPTGGVVEYDWEVGVVGSESNFGIVGNGIYRRVTARRLYREENALEMTTTFSRPESLAAGVPGTVDAGRVDVDSLDSAGSLLKRDRHYYYGTPTRAFFDFTPLSYAPWYEGKEYKTEVIDGSGSTVLRRVEQTWQLRAPVGWWPRSTNPDGTPFYDDPSNDPRIVETTTTVEPGGANLVAKQTFGYSDDAHNNLTDTFEYGFGQGAPGPLVRRTQTYFQTSSAYTGADVHLRGLPVEQFVTDGSFVRSHTTFEYDNYTADAPLVPRSSPSGHDAAFDTAFTRRGNVTAITRHLYVNGAGQGTAVVTQQQFDILGNVVKSVDGRGHATDFEYEDRFGSPDAEARSNTAPAELSAASRAAYVFPTKVTNALGHTVYTQFDYYTGAPVNAEDTNGTVSGGSYDDPLDRMTSAESAVNHGSLHSQARVSYDDANRTITTTTDQNSFNDNALKSQAIYDGLGRTVETRRYETATDYIAVRTMYDDFGRVKATSNPFRPALNEVPVWTTTRYDALGRVTEVKTPDGAKVLTAYVGNAVTVTDPAGRVRRSVSDALGRLVQVYEAPDRADYNHLTSYEYDALGNLTKVVQGGQTRTFVYDSLSRLILARHPEQDATLSDSRAAGLWSVKYSYDRNGNLEQQTDARGVRSDFIYDELNRLKNVSYTDGTPSVAYRYDDGYTDAAGVFRPVGNATGRLTEVRSSVSASIHSGYDALGRVTASAQITGGQTYTMPDYRYNLAGQMTSQTYPSGRVVATEYDGAGRLAGVKNGQTGAYYAGGAPGDGANRVRYAAHGGVSALRLGNGLWEHTGYNNRLQADEIMLGTAGNPAGLLKLTYSFGTPELNHTDNNGNVRSQTITLPGLTLTQTYTYDPLNRLQTARETGGAAESWKQRFTYDRYGNRTVDENPAHTTPEWVGPDPDISPATNRIAPRPGEHYRYDPAGNLDRDHLNNSYLYDANHRLVSFNGGAGQPGGSSYGYDGTGRRVKKVTPAGTTLFVYNVLGQLVAEYSNVSRTTDGGASYLTTDTLGTPRVVTGSGGEVKARHDYLPFGEELPAGWGTRSADQKYVADGVRQKFTGYERDDETGLDFAQARYYSSTVGRFTGVDPLLASARPADPQSWNRYAYVVNDPLGLVDPSGMNYFVGGSGAHDPFIKEYRIDGFEQSPDGTFSNLDRESMAGITPQADDIGGPPPTYGTVDDTGNVISFNSQQVVTVSYSANSTVVIVWNPVKGINPSSAFGHVSYITMQDDQSYSWPRGLTDLNDWDQRTPSARYTDERRQDSAGRGYVLDFGARLNEKFQNALIHAYDKDGGRSKRTYTIWNYNCGKAFNAAINAIRGDLRSQFGINLPQARGIRPSRIESYIQRHLQPFVKLGQVYPMP